MISYTQKSNYTYGDHPLSDGDRLVADVMALKEWFNGLDLSDVPDEAMLGNWRVRDLRYSIARFGARVDDIVEALGYENPVVELMATYDWDNAMEYAKFSYGDIAEVISSDQGENDGNNWLLLVKMKNGSYGTLSAGCDYTGWDCQAGGDSSTFLTLEDALAFFSESDRKRMGL